MKFLSLTIIFILSTPLMANVCNLSNEFDFGLENSCLKDHEASDPSKVLEDTARLCACQKGSITGFLSAQTMPDTSLVSEQTQSKMGSDVDRYEGAEQLSLELHKFNSASTIDTDAAKKAAINAITKMSKGIDRNDRNLESSYKWASGDCHFLPGEVARFRKLPPSKLMKDFSNTANVDEYFRENRKAQKILTSIDPSKVTEFKNEVMTELRRMAGSKNIYESNNWVEIENSFIRGSKSKMETILSKWKATSDKEFVTREKQKLVAGMNNLGYGKYLSYGIWSQVKDDLKNAFQFSFRGELPSLMDCYMHSAGRDAINCTHTISLYCKAVEKEKPAPSVMSNNKIDPYKVTQFMSEENVNFMDYLEGLKSNEKLYDKIGQYMCGQGNTLKGIEDNRGHAFTAQLTMSEFKKKLCGKTIKVKAAPDFVCKNNDSDYPMLNYLYFSTLDADTIKDLKNADPSLAEEIEDFMLFSRAHLTKPAEKLIAAPEALDMYYKVMKSDGNYNKTASEFLKDIDATRKKTDLEFATDPKNQTSIVDVAQNMTRTISGPTSNETAVSTAADTAPVFNPIPTTTTVAPTMPGTQKSRVDDYADYKAKISELTQQLQNEKDAAKWGGLKDKIKGLEDQLAYQNKSNDELSESSKKLSKKNNRDLEDGEPTHNESESSHSRIVSPEKNLNSISRLADGSSTGGTTGSNGSAMINSMGSGSAAAGPLNTGSLNFQAARVPASASALNLNSALLSKYGITVTDASQDGSMVFTEDKTDANAALLVKEAASAQEVPLTVTEEVYQGFLKKDSVIMNQYMDQLQKTRGQVVRVKVHTVGKSDIEVYAIKDKGKIVFQTVKRTAEYKNLLNEMKPLMQ